MSVYDFTLGTNRLDKKTTQVQWDWEEIVKRLRKVEYAEHTMAQYKAMDKTQRVSAKDVGFFIAGKAQGRKCIYRQLLALDVDEVNDETLALLRDFLSGHTYVLHTTHSSTPEEKRYRVLMPLDKIVMADEYGAIMRILSEKLKLPIDVATLDFNRIMFLPSIPKDAEYEFYNAKGKTLNVDELLSSVNWRDLSGLDVPKASKVEDPKFKSGIIGAFCAKVSIREAMDVYLSDVWKKESNNRYTYIGASTTHGGVIYEDKYLFSIHSTDVHRGHTHNAYDAVRLYRFAKDKKDDKGKTGEAEMLKLCESLGIRADSGKKHSLYVESLDDEDASTILKERLEIDKNGNLIKSISNAELIMENDPELKDVIAKDLFSDMPVLKRVPYWRSFDIVTGNEDCKNAQTYVEMTDTDESFIRAHYEQKYDFDVRACLPDALNIISHKNSFHPVRDYLNSLTWDGVPRLANIFIDCFGVADSVYAREVGIKFFVGAVRRVFRPASKMDYIPVLVSEEGLGKSRFIRRMAKLWGSDTFYTFNGGKEAYEQLRGVWILEIPELNGVQNRSTNSRKAFVTKASDRYRSAYMKYTKTYDRQCVFIASSNDIIFLDDPSEDGRRWWGMMCNADKIKINVHSDEFLDLVDMYWAEAVYHYMQGVEPVLSEQADTEAKIMRQVHKAEDLDLGALEAYLNMPVPKDWYDGGMTTFDKKQYFADRPRWKGKPRDFICNTEVAREFYEYERKDITVQIGRKVSDAIERTRLFYRDGTKRRFGEYGSALAWIRKEKIE